MAGTRYPDRRLDEVSGADPALSGTVSLTSIAPVLLTLSGAAALAYQLTWVRLLELSFGSTTGAVSTVLAAFFLGMALGNAGSARLLDRNLTARNLYVWLEGGIALFGLLSLPMLLGLENLIVQIPGLGLSLPLRFTLAFVVLVIPTFCMGATYPVLVAAAGSSGGTTTAKTAARTLDEQLGRFYAWNTLGGVLGAITAGFVLIPRFGLRGTLWVAVAGNLLVVLLAMLPGRRRGSEAASTTQVEADGRSDGASERGSQASPMQKKEHRKAPAVPVSVQRMAGLMLLVTGVISLAAEVAWTKYFSIFTGGTVFGFAAILATFLIGIALGAAVFTRLPSPRRIPWAIARGALFLSLGLLLTRWTMAQAPEVYDSLARLEASTAVRHGLRYAFVFVALLPATLILGILFPFHLGIWSQADERRVGNGYAINTVGGIVGSIATAFWWIPSWGTDSTLYGLAVAPAVAVVGLALSAEGLRRAAIVGLPLLLILDWPAEPKIDYRPLLDQVRHYYNPTEPPITARNYTFVEEAKTGVITIDRRQDGVRSLRSNGLQEATFAPDQPDRVIQSEALLGVVPPLLHSHPQRAFVIGLGGGNTLDALARTEISQIRVAEIEPAVERALRAERGNALGVLDDPRLEILHADARHLLAVSVDTWDIIVSQPSHPWLAGAGKLFTREFFDLVGSRLAPQGIFGQWVNLFQMDTLTLRSLLAAFYGSFDHGFLFVNMPTADLILIGSNSPIILDRERIDSRLREPALMRILSPFSITGMDGLLPFFGLSHRQALAVAGNAPVNTDLRLYSEVRLAMLERPPEGRDDPYFFLREHYSFDIQPYLEPDDRLAELERAAEFFYRVGAQNPFAQALRQVDELDRGRGTSLRRRLGLAPPAILRPEENEAPQG